MIHMSQLRKTTVQLARKKSVIWFFEDFRKNNGMNEQQGIFFKYSGNRNLIEIP